MNEKSKKNGMCSVHQMKVIRLWAGLDFIVTFILMVPISASWFVSVLFEVNGLLGGTSGPPILDPVFLFFVCLTGTLGVTWAVARLFFPTAQLALIDSVARIWVSGLIIYFVFSLGAISSILIFVISELAGSAHQGYVILKKQKQLVS